MTRVPTHYSKPDPEAVAEMLKTMTYEQIAQKLGKNRAWVNNFVVRNRLGGVSLPGAEKLAALNSVRPTKEDFAKLALEMTKGQMAIKFDVKPKTVQAWARMYGVRLKMPVRPTPEEWREQCRSMTSRELMKYHGVSESTIWQWSSDFGTAPVRMSSSGNGGPAHKIPSEQDSGMMRDWARRRMSGAVGINGVLRGVVYG